MELRIRNRDVAFGDRSTNDILVTISCTTTRRIIPDNIQRR